MTDAKDDTRAKERANLFRAAFAVLRRNGYAEANITDILAEAKISTRAFYRHFASKDELLLALFRENATKSADELEARVLAAGTPYEQLLRWVDDVLDMGYDPKRARVSRIFAAPGVPSAFDEAGYEAVAQMYRPLYLVLKDGAASGAFPDCRPPVDARTIHAIVWQLFHDALHGRAQVTREEARAQVLRYVHPALGLPSAS